LLSVIVSHAELAMMELQPSDPVYKNLHGIVTVTKHSAKLTHQLLAFSRQQAIAPKRLNLNQIIENMLSTLRQLIGKNIALHWEPDVNLWTVNMDPAQIDQILANLVINARDAIKKGGKVTIETKNVLLNKDAYTGYVEFVPGQYVLLTVRDNGCGMDKETLPKIFEPFFTTKKKGKGTGLGLATVYGIIKQNNGLIEVDSKTSKGTAFLIYLPRFKET
jgi:signal transduction histidine kinase